MRCWKCSVDGGYLCELGRKIRYFGFKYFFVMEYCFFFYVVFIWDFVLWLDVEFIIRKKFILDC